MSFIRLAARASALPTFARTAPRVQRQLLQRAAYSAQAGLSRDVIQSRVFEVLKGFEKVNPEKVVFLTCLLYRVGAEHFSIALCHFELPRRPWSWQPGSGWSRYGSWGGEYFSQSRYSPRTWLPVGVRNRDSRWWGGRNNDSTGRCCQTHYLCYFVLTNIFFPLAIDYVAKTPAGSYV